MQSHFLLAADARLGENASLRSTVELAALFRTGLKSAFLAASAADRRSVQWKASSGAVES